MSNFDVVVNVVDLLEVVNSFKDFEVVQAFKFPMKQIWFFNAGANITLRMPIHISRIFHCDNISHILCCQKVSLTTWSFPYHSWLLFADNTFYIEQQKIVYDPKLLLLIDKVKFMRGQLKSFKGSLSHHHNGGK